MKQKKELYEKEGRERNTKTHVKFKNWQEDTFQTYFNDIDEKCST